MLSKSLKNKILIIGCGSEQIDTILNANRQAFYTIGIDANSNAPGKKYCDKFINIDFRNLKKVLEIAKKYNVEAVVSASSDLAVPTVNYINKNIKKIKSGYFLDELVTNKFLMKKNFKKNNIQTPDFFEIKNLNDFNKFEKKNKLPLVIKPFFSFGQKGIFLIKNKKDKKNLKDKIKAVKLTCQRKKILVEKFEQGKEINIVAIIENYKIKFIIFSHRIKDYKKAFGIANKHIYPIDISIKQKNIVKKDICKIAKSVKLKNGILYPQIILSNKKISFLEVAARIPGGNMRELFLLASGYDLVEYELYRSLGYRNIFSKIKKHKKYKYVNIDFFTKLNYPFNYFKEVKNLKQIQNIKGVYSLSYNIKKGEKIPHLKSSNDRFGSLITYSNKYNYIVKVNRELSKKIRYIK